DRPMSSLLRLTDKFAIEGVATWSRAGQFASPSENRLRRTTMTRYAYATFCWSILCFFSGTASAQYSKDASTATMEASNLFEGHSNFCDSSEAFVATGPGSSIGFCIEKNLRNSGATAEFEVARRYCIEAGKRLPEPMEYKDACINSGYYGLNDMANSTGEW